VFWQTGPVEHLLARGLAATMTGVWRGHANPRLALVPLVHSRGAATTAEATGPLPERACVRCAAGNLVAAVGWLVLAMYGLFLVASAEAAR
jgi:hypothetical protein